MLDWDIRIIGITDERYMEGRFFEKIERAIQGGVRVIEIREKGLTGADFFEKAKETLKICRERGAKLIVNDRVDIALAIGADGVHLGKNDLPVKEVRRIFDGVIGWTARSLEDALVGEEAGADYIGAGSVFRSETKQAMVIGIEGLKRIKEAVNIPVVAVGGITHDNVGRVMEAGVDGIAVSQALFSGDPYENAVHLLRIMEGYVNN
ncbi:MAG TPA: thiamine phosphate synthase [candidate division WOR-3 bacterium]|uniref:Thiamine-phosphate synthase n=1 Tax=candidate division WOR-3 bacterium TaxID=2052148 RepID=A0A7C0VA57_UNCW3|nr:thiamine phosphate synthase [candidate division WOR-3 bacterium]